MSFEKINLSIGEDIGPVYIAEDKIFRCINANSTSAIMTLFQSGLIQELIDRKLFPKTEISKESLYGYSVVFEQEKISPIIYPFEWSPEMLRRAALCVLEVNECCHQYGYELKDGHPYNVVFNFNNPLFVDLGSIVKINFIKSEWTAYEEFVGTFYYPLKMFEKNLTSVGGKLFLGCGNLEKQRVELGFLLYYFFRFIGIKNTAILLKFLSAYKHGPAISLNRVNKYSSNKAARIFIKNILWTHWLPFRKSNKRRIKSKIECIKFSGSTQWGNYHKDSNLYLSDGSLALTARFEWVVNKVAEIAPKTIIDLAGNQGVLSRALANLKGVDQVICADYDKNAIDAGFRNIVEGEKVSIACFDLLGEEWQMLSKERCRRLRSDLVIALAVTHHLILTQKYNIEAILEILRNYSNKYIIVEFMPLGLWDGIESQVLPDWYNEVWFVSHLKKYFDIKNREVLEENRIIFFAEKIIY